MAGRHSLRGLPRLAGLLGLVVALIAGGRLLTLPEPKDAGQPAAAAAETSLAELWADARIVTSPGRLADGRAYTPVFHLDAEVSVGTALSGDGAGIRLVVRRPDGTAAELMRLPSAENPQFNGFTVAGDDLLWMVSASETTAGSTLFRADWRRGGPATALTSDTGDVVFFNSQYDLVVADGRVHWAAARQDEQVTEVRSVPVRGGAVTARRVDGAYALSAWPWMTSAGSNQSGPVELRNLSTGQRTQVAGAANELVTCGPVWCRVLVLGAAGQPARTDVIRPDGSDRTRIAGGNITSAVLDVALVERFELLSVTGSDDASANLKVILYDLRAKRSVVLAEGVATVQARGAVVWWSTGDSETVEWHALDLRTLK